MRVCVKERLCVGECNIVGVCEREMKKQRMRRDVCLEVLKRYWGVRMSEAVCVFKNGSVCVCV